MKVLMLGWEFPPHISGGLGTACAGLTQALEKEDIDILFVVPKLHGGESAKTTTFVNASTVPIRRRQIFLKDKNVTGAKISWRRESVAKGLRRNIAGQSQVEIASFLTPYTVPGVPAPGLRQWNYSFSEDFDRTLPANLRSKPDNSPREHVRFVKEPYEFSGAYGNNLLEEVEHYALAVAAIARTHSFDVIHAHDWMTYKAGLAAKQISGKPLIVHVHATEIDRSGEHVNSEIFQIEKEGMQSADKVVAVSHWTKNIAVKNYDIEPEKIEVIHNGINPKSLPERQPSTPPLGAPIVTFLGRITHQKGPMYFVEAARRVHEQFRDAHFVVAGSGDQLPMMIERIAQLRLSKSFHFTGFLKGGDIDRIWALSNVYVMPSVSEPFGIAPLEAIQAGVPVILSKQAGVSEVMPHAIKVDFWNCDAFAEAICNVLRFKSLANTLKKNGSEEIKNITWDNAAKKLTTLYNDLSLKQQKRQKPGTLLPGSPTKKVARTPVF